MKSFENPPKFHTKQVHNRFLLKSDLWQRYIVSTWIDFNFELFTFLPQFKTSIRNLLFGMDFSYWYSFWIFEFSIWVHTRIVFMIDSNVRSFRVSTFWYAKLEIFLSKTKGLTLYFVFPVIVIPAMFTFYFCPKLQDKHCREHYDYDRENNPPP